MKEQEWEMIERKGNPGEKKVKDRRKGNNQTPPPPLFVLLGTTIRYRCMPNHSTYFQNFINYWYLQNNNFEIECMGSQFKLSQI